LIERYEELKKKKLEVIQPLSNYRFIKFSPYYQLQTIAFIKFSPYYQLQTIAIGKKIKIKANYWNVEFMYSCWNYVGINY